jgi:hypothetical protein
MVAGQVDMGVKEIQKYSKKDSIGSEGVVVYEMDAWI